MEMAENCGDHIPQPGMRTSRSRNMSFFKYNAYNLMQTAKVGKISL